MDRAKRYGAEFLGTLLLVFFGVGSAIAGRVEGGVVVVALAFGLILLALAYALGPVSGCHVNPAVTLGALLTGRIDLANAVAYWLVQFAAATVAAFGLYGLTRWGGVTDQTGALGTNSYGPHINLGGTMVLETVLTFLLVLVVLVVTSRTENAGFAGLAIGIALAACHLVGIPLDGTSVNPARSFGPAVFEGGTRCPSSGSSSSFRFWAACWRLPRCRSFSARAGATAPMSTAPHGCHGAPIGESRGSSRSAHCERSPTTRRGDLGEYERLNVSHDSVPRYATATCCHRPVGWPAAHCSTTTA